MSDYLDPNNKELLKDFFSEAQAQANTLEQNILVLENEGGDKDAVDEIFRAAHTLKGGSATVEMMELSHFTRLVEDVLDAVRSEQLAVTDGVVDALLSAIDVIKAMLDQRMNGSVYQEDTSRIEGRLSALLPRRAARKRGAAKPAALPPSPAALSEYELLEMKQAAAGPAAPGPAEGYRVPAAGVRESANAGKAGKEAGSILRVDSRRIDGLLNLVSETVIAKAAFNQLNSQFNDLLADLRDTADVYREKIKGLFDSLPGYLENMQEGGAVKDIRKDIGEQYGDIFSLFDGIEASLKASAGKFRSTSRNLGRITRELQEGVMRIRMAPISQIFSRFPRLVRDLSKSLNKKIALVIEGEETELDKSVIEDLLDPIMHSVRNAIDHGVESPEERRAAGKPEEGTVLLRAANEGNMIAIEISDDGKGIDVEAVKAKAVEQGVISPDKLLSDVEVFNLIFEPGFSTAGAITAISGRGAGLDVVRRQIEKLNGTVTVSSERGKGTKFIIKLPLSLAIIQGLLVRVGTEVYSIPITSVVESLRIKPEDIKMIDNNEVCNIRNDEISLLRLNRLFGIKTEEPREYAFIVIVGSAEKKMGFLVDSLIGEEDVVIKPLRDQFTNAPGIAGASILGDGSVSLIIDVSRILEMGLRKELEQHRVREASAR